MKKARISPCVKHGPLLVTSLVTALAMPVGAETIRAIEFGLLSTDNAELSENNERSEFAFTFTPSVETTINRRLFDTAVIGELAYYKFDDSGDDVIDPRIRVRSRGFLIPEFLSLDAGFRIAKSLSDFDVFRLTRDSKSAMLVRINPEITKRFGDFAQLDIGYLHQSIDDTLDGTIDGTDNALSMYFGRDPLYHSLLWGLGASYDLSKSREDRVETYNLYYSLGYAISRTSSIELSAGQEWNDFEGIEDEDQETTIWDMFYRWRPSERTSLDVGYGQRFFGTGPTLRFRQTSEKSDLRFTWLRGVTRTAPRLDGISSFDDVSEGSLDSPPSEGSLGETPLLTELTEKPFAEDQLRLEYKLTGRRSDLVFDLVYAIQDELEGTASIETLLGRVSLDRYLSAKSRLRWSYNYSNSRSDERADLNYDENRFSVRWIRTLK